MPSWLVGLWAVLVFCGLKVERRREEGGEEEGGMRIDILDFHRAMFCSPNYALRLSD
jgi:hypothetical protein